MSIVELHAIAVLPGMHEESAFVEKHHILITLHTANLENYGYNFRETTRMKMNHDPSKQVFLMSNIYRKAVATFTVRHYLRKLYSEEF